MASNFYVDVGRGKLGEQIFVEDFLNLLNISFVDVSGCQKFQVRGTDFMVAIGTYEVKLSYKDDQFIVIEEFSNFNGNLAPIKPGWFYTTQSDMVVFISKESRTMIMVPMTLEFRLHYELIKENYALRANGVTECNGRKWQSSFRRIPLSAISGYYGIYKKG